MVKVKTDPHHRKVTDQESDHVNQIPILKNSQREEAQHGHLALLLLLSLGTKRGWRVVVGTGRLKVGEGWNGLGRLLVPIVDLGLITILIEILQVPTEDFRHLLEEEYHLWRSIIFKQPLKASNPITIVRTIFIPQTQSHRI